MAKTHRFGEGRAPMTWKGRGGRAVAPAKFEACVSNRYTTSGDRKEKRNWIWAQLKIPYAFYQMDYLVLQKSAPDVPDAAFMQAVFSGRISFLTSRKMISPSAMVFQSWPTGTEEKRVLANHRLSKLFAIAARNPNQVGIVTGYDALRQDSWVKFLRKSYSEGSSPVERVCFEITKGLGIVEDNEFEKFQEVVWEPLGGLLFC